MPPSPVNMAIELTGSAAVAVRTRELVRRAAALDSCVLLVAEAGVDVESVGRELHSLGPAEAPFVSVDCGATVGGATERVLFGNPLDQSKREFEQVSKDSELSRARNGTLFLHGLCDVPAGVQ